MQTLDQAVTAAISFRPLTDAQVASMLARTAPLAADGAGERYKTTLDFDATTHHPEWLGTQA